MTVIADYANLYENEIRPRQEHCRGRGLRYIPVLAVWLSVFLVRPRLALAIWRERS